MENSVVGVVFSCIMSAEISPRMAELASSLSTTCAFLAETCLCDIFVEMIGDSLGSGMFQAS